VPVKYGGRARRRPYRGVPGAGGRARRRGRHHRAGGRADPRFTGGTRSHHDTL